MLIVTAVGAAWVVLITVLIATQPSPGVASPDELRSTLATALRDGDQEALEQVLDYPTSDAEDFAGAYLDRFRNAGAQVNDVRLGPDPGAPRLATISGELAAGGRFSYTLAVQESGGQWTVTFAPPLL